MDSSPREMNWMESQGSGGLLTCTCNDEVTFTNVEIFEKLSDLQNYCYGRQQQIEILT